MAASSRLGIDFGTSHTVAFLTWPDGRVRPLLFDGSPLLPSAVCGDVAGGFLVGRDALHSARAYPERFEPNPKRRIDDGMVLLGEAEVPVADLIAPILARVAREARQAVGAPPAAVALTHPAAWGPPRLTVLRAAARAAGLGEPELLPEPIAAATYYVAQVHRAMPRGRYIVVYDLGAGTFDISVMRRTAGGFEVVAADGLADVGGLDVDEALVAYLGATYAPGEPEAWRRLEQPASTGDRWLRRMLWEDVRTAKEMLSRSSATVVHLPGLDVDAPLGREQLDRLAGPLLRRTVQLTTATLRSARVETADVAAVFLVGGASRMPLVATLLHRAIGIAPTAIEQPELVVAEGALLTAADATRNAGSGPLRRELPPDTEPAWPEPADITADTRDEDEDDEYYDDDDYDYEDDDDEDDDFDDDIEDGDDDDEDVEPDGEPAGKASTPAGTAVESMPLRVISLTLPSGSGYTVRYEQPTGDAADTVAGFATDDGRLLLFHSVAELKRHLRTAPSSLPQGLHHQAELVARIPKADLTPDDADRYPLEDVLFNLRGGRDSWEPDLLIRCRNIAAEIANALELGEVHDLLAKDSYLDRFDEVLREINTSVLAWSVRRKLRSFAVRDLVRRWRRLVAAVDQNVEWHS